MWDTWTNHAYINQHIWKREKKEKKNLPFMMNVDAQTRTKELRRHTMSTITVTLAVCNSARLKPKTVTSTVAHTQTHLDFQSDKHQDWEKTINYIVSFFIWQHSSESEPRSAETEHKIEGLFFGSQFASLLTVSSTFSATKQRPWEESIIFSRKNHKAECL